MAQASLLLFSTVTPGETPLAMDLISCTLYYIGSFTTVSGDGYAAPTICQYAPRTTRAYACATIAYTIVPDAIPC